MSIHKQTTLRLVHQREDTPAPSSNWLSRLMGYVCLIGGSSVFMGMCLGAIWLGPGMVLDGLLLFLSMFVVGVMCFGVRS